MLILVKTGLSGLMHRLRAQIRRERGQTTVEYVVVSAVATVMAIAITWVALSGALTAAVNAIGSSFQNWITGNIS